jgi:DNA-binding Xre family transcriptional regulator
MLYIEIKSLMEAKGMKTTHAKLTRLGISHSSAQRLLAGKAVAIKLEFLEKLCLLLVCTPNDILVWEPPDEMTARANPLGKLRSPGQTIPRIAEKLSNKTPEELERILAMID